MRVKKNMDHFRKCLAKRWGDFVDQAPDLGSLKSWGKYFWPLKGNPYLDLLGGSLTLFGFEHIFNEAERVWHMENIFFRGKRLHLD